MNVYVMIHVLHIVSAAVLFGGGASIAFFMYGSFKEESIRYKYIAAKMTVKADFLFTLPAAIIQPVSGWWLAHLAGYSFDSAWLFWSIALYIFIGCLWIPVIFIQCRLRDLAAHCLMATNEGESKQIMADYHKLARIWGMLGWPAFMSVLVVFFLMVGKFHV